MTTHPQGPAGPGPGRSQALAEVVDAAQKLAHQLLAVLEQQVDPASEPRTLAEPADETSPLVHAVLLDRARRQIVAALRCLDVVGDLPIPAPADR
jgi:hypothetical protein